MLSTKLLMLFLTSDLTHNKFVDISFDLAGINQSIQGNERLNPESYVLCNQIMLCYSVI